MSDMTTIEGSVLAVCISREKGVPKTEIPAGTLIAGHGILGDAHAGGWHRQVSLLGKASIDKMQGKGIELGWGDFAENLTIEGIELYSLPVGTRLAVFPAGGDILSAVILEVTQIGKECHHGCAIFQIVGDCVMPREGIFTKVIRGGEVRAGYSVREYPPDRFLVASITASDKGSRGEREDKSGQVIAKMIAAAGGEMVAQIIVPDEKEVLKKEMLRLVDEVGVDLIITTGGTGLGPRDVTPDATLLVIDKVVPGIAEAMRMESLLKTPRAMLSRAVAGIRRLTLIVNVPGSPRAVEECLEAVLPALPHGIQILRSQASECARP
jgi:molybdopterin adenylyltransferase